MSSGTSGDSSLCVGIPWKEKFRLCDGTAVSGVWRGIYQNLYVILRRTADLVFHGTEKSTVCKTYENREEHLTGDGRYERLCRMQKACDYRQERPLQRMMREYEALSAIAQEQFQRR